jgi:uncharacterized protein YecT (DUF1311 family)
MTTFFALVVMSVAPYAASEEQPSPSEAQAFRPSFDKCVDGSEGVTLTMNNCLGAEYDYQDKRLNDAYQWLRKSLSGSARTALRDEERAWMASRDKSCAPDPDGGTATMLDANQCQLHKTAARAAELEKRATH